MLAARLTRFAVHRVSRVLTPMERRFPGRRVLDSETAQQVKPWNCGKLILVLRIPCIVQDFEPETSEVQ